LTLILNASLQSPVHISVKVCVCWLQMLLKGLCYGHVKYDSLGMGFKLASFLLPKHALSHLNGRKLIRIK